ncbi:hypothetical protein [Crateriforma conspicua]|nr:hypothetical protein [Crateriforma conspicua]
MFAVVALITTASTWWLVSDVSSTRWQSDGDRDRYLVMVNGLYYGAFSGFVWWSSCWRRGLARWTMVAAAVGGCAGVLAMQSGRPWMMYVASLVGLAAVQSFVFWFTRVPTWRPRESRAAVDVQYRIADLVALTAAVAIMITTLRAYYVLLTDADLGRSLRIRIGVPSDQYWTSIRHVLAGWCVVWIWLPIFSVLIGKTVLAARAFTWIGGGVAATAWSILALFVLSRLQVQVGGRPPELSSVYWGDYATFAVLYATSVAAIALSGRLDTEVAGGMMGVAPNHRLTNQPEQESDADEQG